MAMNRVQFQAGLSMTAFLQQYGTEAKCYRALYRMRWPQGFCCPACNSRTRSRFRRADRVYYQCRSCRHQTTLTSGTLFAARKLSLTKWLLSTHLLTASKTNLAAVELMRQLDVCYATAWTENKQPFVIAVSTDATLEHPTFAVIEPVRRFDNDSLRDWAARRLAPEAGAYTDGLGCFRRIEEAGHAHTVLVTGGGRAATQAQGARWVNVLLANVKRAISDSYHVFRQAKYARRYLAEAAYRLNRRFHLAAMLP